MNRKHGLSAMLRIKNEEDFIRPCIESIVDWFDEVVVCLQNCIDSTEDIVRSFDNKKIKIYKYNTDSWPNGDGYDKQDATDRRSRTYFYNWCLDKTNYSHVCKWDGDMVAMDWLCAEVKELLKDDPETIYFYGTDIVGKYICHVGEREHCATEPRIFKVTKRTRYVNGSKCERLQTSGGIGTAIHRPAFLHFKWAKPIETATQAWPDGWKESTHFQNIIKRAEPVNKYTGEYPSTIRGLVGHV